MTNNKRVSAFKNDLLSDMDATSLSTAIKNKEFTAEEVVKAAIERVQEVNPIINAVASSGYDMALKQAKNVQGDLAGVPIFLKDQVNMKGLPTLHGSRSVPSGPQKKNDKTVDQILSTGCVVLGKSTSSELGVLPCGETIVSGNTLNPWNTDYSTGGSSAGSGALVASGALPISHAMDGGGSIRIPAACCGLIGMKPTRGRHIESPVKIFPVDFVEQGVVSRTVRDTANYLAAIEKFYQTKHLPAIGKVEQPGSKRLRIGLYTDSLSGIESDKEIVLATHQVGKSLESLGHHVEIIRNPFGMQFKLDFTTYYTFVSFLAKYFGMASFGLKFSPSKLEPFTKHFANLFPPLFAANSGTFKRLKDYNSTYEKNMGQYDVLLCPTISCLVPKIGYWSPDETVMAISDRLSSYINSTMVQNISGAPAVSLPLGQDHHGLPMGMHFAAKQGQERMLLELAFELEANGAFMPFINEVEQQTKTAAN